jgi:4-hydroxy-2-oxoglutarate aldolase
MLKLAGIYPPIVTAFNADESVAFDKLETNLMKWVTQPIDGIVVPGSNSESAYMTLTERLDVIRLCVDLVKPTGKHVIAGTGMETTSGTVDLTCKAAELGATAALLLPPYFFKMGMNHEVLLAHFITIAEQSPIPLLIYNVPAFTGVEIGPKTLIELAQHPGIVGVKDSSSSITKMADVLASAPDFQVFAGTGSAFLSFLSIGAIGGIMALANFAACPLRRIYDAYLSGRMEEAKQIQLSLALINTAVTSTYGVPGLKYAMDRAGFFGGNCRRPLLPLKLQGRNEIDHIMKGLDLS